jgi:hypothetical protein
VKLVSSGLLGEEEVRVLRRAMRKVIRGSGEEPGDARVEATQDA